MNNTDNIYTLNNINDFYIATKDSIYNYCINNDIDTKDIPPSIWNDILYQLAIDIYLPNKSFYYKGKYIIESLNDIYECIYKRICYQYKRDINITGFCCMVQVERQTLYNISDSVGVSDPTFDFRKKIKEDNESSLECLLQDKSLNPMKILPILNRRHNWSDSNQKAQSVNINLIARENIQELPVNDSQILLP